MLTRLFGEALLPQTQLPAFAASNPNAVLRDPYEVVWFTGNAMFKVVYDDGTYRGWAYETTPDDEFEPKEYFAQVSDSVLDTVVERLAVQWQNHFK